MIVIGFIIFDPPTDNVSQAPLVYVVFERDYFITHQLPVHLISFGTLPLHRNSINPIELAAGQVMTGVGISPAPNHELVPANADDPAFVISIHPSCLLRQGNEGLQLNVPEGFDLNDPA
jgi:hypothetical protein